MKTRIKEFRARYDMTQEDLAEKVWVNRTTIAFLEKWRYNPSLKLAKLISLALKEPIDSIFLWETGELD
jgi:DNA-binding XRE family transcriptional regulator